MNIIDRLENFKLENQDHADIAYLKQSNIGGIINRGLSDLYKTQPKNPITFLANWLLNESRSNLIKERIEQDKKTKNELKEVYLVKREKEEKEKAEQDEIDKKKADEKSEFIDKIKNSKDIEDDLNFYCHELQKFSGATGVYISILDKKRKDVTDDDDENAHLSDQIVIRYVNFCDDHKFLKYKFLENEQGITYDLFKPKEDNPDEPKDENKDAENNPEGTEENEENAKKKEKEYIPNHLIIDEVVRNPKMKFFREPKLGCYLAIDLTYKSSLSTASLNSSIEVLNEYNTKMADYEVRKKEFYEKLAEENANKEQPDNPEGQPEGENPEQEFPAENIEIAEFEKTEKKYILSLDTIGQDRIFSDEEKKFIFEVQKTIKENWENLEKNLLLKDRDAKIELTNKEKVYIEGGNIERLEVDEEKFIKEYFVENPMNDEREKEIETQFQKGKFILHIMQEDPVLNEMFMDISKNEVNIFIFFILFDFFRIFCFGILNF